MLNSFLLPTEAANSAVCSVLAIRLIWREVSWIPILQPILELLLSPTPNMERRDYNWHDTSNPPPDAACFFGCSLSFAKLAFIRDVHL